MKNEIIGFRHRIVVGLLSRMDADIVAPDGSLPKVSVERIGRLMSGGSILLSTPDSKLCYLETNDENVEYQPRSLACPSCIAYTEKVENPKKFARKDRNYRFVIELAGQRKRS